MKEHCFKAMLGFSLLIFACQMAGCKDMERRQQLSPSPRDELDEIIPECTCMAQDDITGLENMSQAQNAMGDTISRLEARLELLEASRREDAHVIELEGQAIEALTSVAEELTHRLEESNARIASLEAQPSGGVSTEVHRIDLSAVQSRLVQLENPIITTLRTPYFAGGEGGELILCGDTSESGCYHIDIFNRQLRVWSDHDGRVENHVIYNR